MSVLMSNARNSASLGNDQLGALRVDLRQPYRQWLLALQARGVEFQLEVDDERRHRYSHELFQTLASAMAHLP